MEAMLYYLGLSRQKPEVRPLHLWREGGVLGAGLGYGPDGRHGHDDVGQGLGW